MTPYKEALANYTIITPKPIDVVNKHTFHAIRQGDLPIHVPNGKPLCETVIPLCIHSLITTDPHYASPTHMLIY